MTLGQNNILDLQGLKVPKWDPVHQGWMELRACWVREISLCDISTLSLVHCTHI